ncbi:MAG: FkbM family methyltransferase [Planctomycetota bacterium]
MSVFKDSFLQAFFTSIHQHPEHNWDHYRFPDDHPRHRQFLVDRASSALTFILDHAGGFETTYTLLEDTASRELMVQLLVYRVLDHHHVRLPLNTPGFWKTWEAIDSSYLRESRVIETERWALNHYFLPELGIELIGAPGSVMTIFLLKQYYYPGPPSIRPEAGDILIDGGGCWGDTALHFAHSVGERGEVHSFEFVPGNLRIFQRNLELNPLLKDRVHIAPYALSERSGEKLGFDDRGPSTNLAPQGASSVETRSIDTYVAEAALPRVDFIKMDIEGYEAAALRGARRTIARYRPRLAISAYHRPEDFLDLPQVILDIDPGYRFRLGHYTIHNEETILYAIHADRTPPAGRE